MITFFAFHFNLKNVYKTFLKDFNIYRPDLIPQLTLSHYILPPLKTQALRLHDSTHNKQHSNNSHAGIERLEMNPHKLLNRIGIEMFIDSASLDAYCEWLRLNLGSAV